MYFFLFKRKKKRNKRCCVAKKQKSPFYTVALIAILSQRIKNIEVSISMSNLAL